VTCCPLVGGFKPQKRLNKAEQTFLNNQGYDMIFFRCKQKIAIKSRLHIHKILFASKMKIL
jgi:hypothetical protein